MHTDLEVIFHESDGIEITQMFFKNYYYRHCRLKNNKNHTVSELKCLYKHDKTPYSLILPKN